MQTTLPIMAETENLQAQAQSLLAKISEPVKFYRYPNVDTFRDNDIDKHVFFGRNTEIEALLNRLLSNKLLVLSGKSGVGKTSLLQAGLFPILKDLGFLPIRLRFNHGNMALLRALQLAVSITCRDQNVVFSVDECSTYWEYFHSALFSKGERFLTPILVMDQFEELFTSQSEDYRQEVAKQLRYLVNEKIPDSVLERLKRENKIQPTAVLPNVRLLISIREDSLGALHELAEIMPEIVAPPFRLTGLDRERARAAIVNPAQFADGRGLFASKPFKYQTETESQSDTVEEILDYLQDKHGNIEPFLLQLICRQIEHNVIERQMSSKEPLVVDLENYLGGTKGMEGLVKLFYQMAVETPPSWWLRRKIRKLCENGLLNAKGGRETLSRTQIKKNFQLDYAILEQLIEKKLLRREMRLDSPIYALRDDTLARAVFNIRRARSKWNILKFVVPVIVLLLGFLLLVQPENTDNQVNQVLNPELEKYREQVIKTVALDTKEASTIKQPKMVKIPKGSFMMGNKMNSNERPVHKVTLPTFLMSAYEVTFEEYDQFAATTEGYTLLDDEGWGRGKRPVINVSWSQANAYANWLSEKTGKHYRLPTEAEWEYAARAGGVEDEYHWGDERKKAKDFAWYDENSAGQTHPVGQKKPNAFGLYDISGNVWEWVQDCYHDNYNLAPHDGSVWQDTDASQCTSRVLRGGSLRYEAWYLRLAYRSKCALNYFDYNIGFRLVQD